MWQPVEGKGIQLEAPLKMSLERAIEYIDADEYVEATPKFAATRAKASGIKRGLAATNEAPIAIPLRERISSQDLRIRFMYKEANQNQRKTAKILGISRATLSRHLRGLDHK